MLPVVHCCVESVLICLYLDFFLKNYTFSIRRCMFTNFLEKIDNFKNVLQKIVFNQASGKIHHMPQNLIINILCIIFMPQ